MTTIPNRYKLAKYEDVPENIRKLVDNIIESRKGIYIHGECGTGKTHIAYAIYNHLIDNLKIKTKIKNLPDLLQYIKKDFDKENELISNENSYFNQIVNFNGLLIIDDIGTEKITEWVEETLYAIINKRYEEIYPTIFTSNLNLSQLKTKYGDRIVSRIVGSCDIIELTGDDKRLT
jgi:DNA replication protein DnaC